LLTGKRASGTVKVKHSEFRIDVARPAEAPLDFPTLCALLAAHQAETPTARIARDGGTSAEPAEHANPAVAVLLATPGQEKAGSSALGSFHAAAAARFNGRSQ
jgi:hypothetical protein